MPRGERENKKREESNVDCFTAPNSRISTLESSAVLCLVSVFGPDNRLYSHDSLLTTVRVGSMDILREHLETASEEGPRSFLQKLLSDT